MVREAGRWRKLHVEGAALEVTSITLFAFWVLPVVGIVYVIGYSALLAPLREWEKLPHILTVLLDCPMCLAFWVGLFVGAMNWLPVRWPMWLQYPAVCAVDAIGIQYLLELAARRKIT